MKNVEDHEKNHHYFASCAFGWKTSDSRETAVSELAQCFYSDMKYALGQTSKRGELGPYIWSCKVLASRDAEYQIEYYKPIGISIGAGVHHYLTNITKKDTAFFSTEDAPKPLRESNAEI